MTRAIVVALLLLSLPAQAGQNSIYPGAEPSGSLSSDPAPTCGGDLSLGGYDIINNRTVLSSDTAPDGSTIKAGQSAYAKATTNVTGGAMAVCGGVGRRFVTITAFATSASDTLTVVVYQNATSATTVLTAGTSFACAAAGSNAACALALLNYLTATPISGVTASCTDGTCSDAKVFFQPAADVCNVNLTWADAGGGGVAGTATQGANGPVLYPTGSAANPSSAFAEAPTTGFYYAGTNAVAVSSNGTLTCYSNTSYGWNCSYPIYATGIVSAAANTVSWLGRSAMSSASDGDVSITPTTTAKGYSNNIRLSSQVLTCAGGGSATLVTSGLIPKGATLQGVSTRITSAGLTGPTSMDVGDGSDPDIYANDTGVADNDVTDGTDITANIANPQLAAGEVTLTFNGGNCTAGTIRVTAHLITITAPTAD